MVFYFLSIDYYVYFLVKPFYIFVFREKDD